MSAIDLYARPSVDYGNKRAITLALLRNAASRHAGRIVQATSLGAEDMVLTDLIAWPRSTQAPCMNQRWH
jgi:phosphoadenosine phosphosulfate reductase